MNLRFFHLCLSTVFLLLNTSLKANSQEEINPCDSYPCLHDGTCIKSNHTDYFCQCNTIIASGVNCEYLNPCSSYPCRHGGICSENSSDYSCKCLNDNSFGKNCEYYVHKYTNSTILSLSQMNDLKELCSFSSNLSVSLVYQASRDGFRAKDFHLKCDGLLNTLVVVKSSNGYVFGGFTAVDWSSGGSLSNYKYDSSAFMFSLINKYNYPFKMKIINPDYAVYASDYMGPVFGSGNDLAISDDSDKNYYSYAMIGNTYQLPPFLVQNHQNAQSFLADSYYFKTFQVEVFLVNDSLTMSCMNDGKYELINSKYACNCSPNYYGNKCEYKRLNSSAFINSSILTNELGIKLLDLINYPSNLNLSLIYQASRDGFKAKDFHLKCDGYLNTLTVIKASNGNIFGGFTTVDWGTPQSNNYYYYSSYFKSDSNAFLFSLVNKYNISLLINNSDPTNAVYAHYDSGPSFGAGYDLYVSDESNKASNSYSYLGFSYKLNSFGAIEKQSLLAGSYSFRTNEIEVYLMDPCWISKCQNGATCQSQANSSICLCPTNYFGNECENTVLNSTMFRNSSILTEEFSNALLNLTGLSIYENFSLIYQARRDGFKTTDFHAKCDGYLNTLVVVKEAGNENILGGFTTIDWMVDNYNLFKSDPNAFSFSLFNEYNISFKVNAINSIYSSNYDGFGFGQLPSIKIATDANLNKNSFSYLSPFNQTIDYYYKRNSYYEIQTFFQALEIEVYTVNDYDACFSWICLNNGTCELLQDGTAACICTLDHYGKMCEYKRLDSTVFINSSILTNELSTQLLDLIEFPSDSKFTLLYQATRDGFKASDFHSKCDGYSETLTVIKSSNGNIFGGFSWAYWGVLKNNSNYYHTYEYVRYNTGYKNDSNAFLFSLVNEFQVPAKFKIHESKSDYAIYSSSYYGPTFGTGFDLFVADESNINTNSYSYLGSAYQFKKGHFKSYNSYLAGSNYFKTVEVEVYQLHKMNDYLFLAD